MSPDRKKAGGGVLIALFSLFTVGLLLFSVYVVYPLSERALAGFLCKGGIVTETNRGRGKGRDITCTEPSTGRTKDISIAQYLACCPTAILPGISILLAVIASSMRRKTRGSQSS